MFATTVIVIVAAAIGTPPDVDVDGNVAPRVLSSRPRFAVGASGGVSFTSQPTIDLHAGAWLRSRANGPFDFRGGVAVDLAPAGGGLLTADIAALFVHSVADRLEFTIGGGPAGGVVAHTVCAADDCDDAVDAVFGIVGVASGTVDILPSLAVGLELRGLAAVVVPTAAPLVSPSLSLTTLWRF